MNKFLLIAFLGFSLNSRAQFFGEGNPVWHYESAPGWGTLTYHFKLWNQKDTIFQGKNCFRLGFEGRGGNFMPYKQMLCVDSSKVMFWSEKSNSFQKLYDFDAKQGDTWELDLDNFFGEKEDIRTLTVDSVYYENINGTRIKVQLVYDSDSAVFGHRNTYKVYEHIGSEIFLFPWDHAHVDGDYVDHIRCFENDSIGFHQFDKSEACDYTEVGLEEEIVGRSIVVYPNPATTHFTIDGLSLSSKDRTVKIYNSVGQLIQEENIAPYNSLNHIELEPTHSAFLVVTVQEDGELVFKERVVLR